MAASREVLSEGERLQRIEALTDGALAYLDTDELLVELLDRVCEMLTADAAVVLLLDESKRQLVTEVARGMEEAVHQGIRVPVGRGFAGRIAQDRTVLAVERVDPADLVDTVLRARGFVSLLGAPLISQGEVIGVIYVGWLEPRAFTEDDIDLLQSAGDRMAVAIQARSSRAEASAARVLQRSLLPAQLPPIPGLTMAARYVPGEGGAIGGDWYDVLTLASGHVCMAVGDVVGHGLRAAVVMGRLRSALRAYALTSTDPGQVLTQLDRKLRHFEVTQMATALYAVFDPLLDRVHLSSAGHLPAMLAPPGEPTVELEVPADPPLGVPLAAQRRTTTFDVPEGGLLCLYTDGLVERRGAHIDDGLALLRRSLTAGSPDEVCGSVMASLVGRTQPRDDIAILAVRREARRERNTLTLPAEPSSLARIRVALRRWLGATDISQLALDDLLVAVGEAAANSIQHAYGPAGGTIDVEVALDETDVIVTVRDTGRWRPSRPDGEEWGLLLMERCSDDVQVARGIERGTEVTIRRRFRREEDT